ncbi:unnamed protein product [Schistosoma rodhaini]|uniref:EGF-like domain-containing protein n=1 Tax=Schistosoma rodhaini TaxID=6188 RepID=A0AA85FQH2_9TREM|nr:unnamed protein product [Schistosoma rodhaini]CAH8537868.1 unnamed protein product [Schistosoma rodhaini]
MQVESCATGWQRPLCDECIKYPGCEHGTCNDAPFTCRCLPNWGGSFCDQDLDYCGQHQPCLNNGICRKLNYSYSKPFNCSCTRDFTGEYCEIKLVPCTIDPCKRGRCISTDNITYECECQPGWRGDHCEESTDQLDNYWHRVVLGIIEIQVDTVVVNENDFGSRLLVPLICATILMSALICIFIICCYSQRKRRQFLMKYATTTRIAPNNEPSSDLIQNLSDSNNHSMNVTNPINITSIHQNYPSYHPQFICVSTLLSKRR